MNEQQPNALRLADALIENADLDSAEGGNPAVCKLEWDAAAELRRLYAVNVVLLVAIQELLDALPSATTHPAIKAARAAIAKAEAQS